MKKILMFALALVIVLGSFSVVNAETFVVTTEKDPLLIRLAEDHNQVLGQTAKGKTLEALYTDKYWAYFYYDGKLAVSYLAFLTPASGAQTKPGPEAPAKTGNSNYKPQPVSTDLASKLYVVKDTVKDHITARDAKSTSAYGLGKFYPGDVLYVIRVGSEWTRIVYNDQYAFVLTKYIEEIGPNLPEAGILYQVKVPDGSTLNVREDATTASAVLRQIPDKAYVKVLEQGDKWSKVYFSNENIGYVMNKYIVPVD